MELTGNAIGIINQLEEPFFIPRSFAPIDLVGDEKKPLKNVIAIFAEEDEV
jgi:hypothetical protein